MGHGLIEITTVKTKSWFNKTLNDPALVQVQNSWHETSSLISREMNHSTRFWLRARLVHPLCLSLAFHFWGCCGWKSCGFIKTCIIPRSLYILLIPKWPRWVLFTLSRLALSLLDSGLQFSQVLAQRRAQMPLDFPIYLFFCRSREEEDQDVWQEQGRRNGN